MSEFDEDNPRREEYSSLEEQIYNSCAILYDMSQGNDELLKYLNFNPDEEYSFQDSEDQDQETKQVETLQDFQDQDDDEDFDDLEDSDPEPLLKSEEFVRNYGINLENLPNPREYAILQRFYEKVQSKIRFRERTQEDLEVLGSVAYLEDLCSKAGERSEILEFIDRTSNPAKILREFRDWAEIRPSEIEEYKADYGLDEREAITSLYIIKVEEEIKNLENKVFMHEEKGLEEKIDFDQELDSSDE